MSGILEALNKCDFVLHICNSSLWLVRELGELDSNPDRGCWENRDYKKSAKERLSRVPQLSHVCPRTLSAFVKWSCWSSKSSAVHSSPNSPRSQKGPKHFRQKLRSASPKARKAQGACAFPPFAAAPRNACFSVQSYCSPCVLCSIFSYPLFPLWLKKQN